MLSEYAASKTLSMSLVNESGEANKIYFVRVPGSRTAQSAEEQRENNQFQMQPVKETWPEFKSNTLSSLFTLAAVPRASKSKKSLGFFMRFSEYLEHVPGSNTCRDVIS